ncbi:MAG: hypothetical protein ACRDZO_20150 [Egibacteraceae bacterium]
MQVANVRGRVLVGSMVILALAACGGGGSSVSPGSPQSQGDIQAYCAAKKAFETAPSPGVDFQSASPQEVAEAGKNYAATTLRPIFDDLIATAPVEVLDASKLLHSGIARLQETGDFFLFNAPEFGAAQTATHLFDREHCGWTQVSVGATDYAYEDVPGTVPAGTVSFDITNRSENEIHEMAILKKADGVTEPIQELLESSNGAPPQSTTLVADGLAQPGDSSYEVVDLQPGNYAMVCFVHVGATHQNPQGDGPQHHAKGMVVEFTVE